MEQQTRKYHLRSIDHCQREAYREVGTESNGGTVCSRWKRLFLSFRVVLIIMVFLLLAVAVVQRQRMISVCGTHAQTV